MSQIIPIRNLKNTAEISEMYHVTKELIFVSKNGYGDMVIMSIEAYEEKIALLDDPLLFNKRGSFLNFLNDF